MGAGLDIRERSQRSWLALDVLLAVGVAGVQLLLLSIAAEDLPAGARGVDAVTVALILCQALPLVARRRWPVAVFVAVLIPNTVYYALGFPPSGLDLGLAVALYTVAARRPRRVSLAACATILLVCTLLWVLQVGPYWSSATLALFVYLLVFFSAAWAWGRYHRTRQQVRDALVAELVAEAEQSERDRASEREKAVVEERRRIARELHDSVAHHLSVMVVQAGAARRVIDQDLASSKEALGAIEETGRRGLDMMPSLIRALRGGDAQPQLAPQPTLSDLPQLLDAVAADLTVSLEMSTDDHCIPAAVQLSAYRVVQEALTNCLKHAPGATVAVRVQASCSLLTLEVTDHGGRQRAASPRDGGHGLVGMRERAAHFGGTLEAAPNAAGGYTVKATFPIGEDSR